MAGGKGKLPGFTDEDQVNISKIGLTYRFALEFGWTPEEIRNIGCNEMVGLLAYMSAQGKHEKAEMSRKDRRQLR